VSKVPEHLSDAGAAACGAAVATAWQGLIERGHVHAGQIVLVQGTGGVAMFGLQFAQLHGAQVIVISSSDEKLACARALGAIAGVNYYRVPEWDRAVLDLTGGEGVDHIVETADQLVCAIGCLKVGGFVSLIGYSGHSSDDNAAPARYSAYFPHIAWGISG